MFVQKIIFALLFSSALSQPSEEDCKDSQFHVDPDNCPEGYFRCVSDGQGGWNIESHECPPGTAFHPDLQQCDWPGDWTDGVCDGATHAPTQPTQPPTQPTEVPEDGKKIVCYYSSWAFYRYGTASLTLTTLILMSALTSTTALPT